MPRILALAGLLAALLPLLAADTRWVAGGGTSARVGVFLDFEQPPSSSAIQAMRREVATLLNETGASFSWFILKTDTAVETFDELAVLRFRGNCRAGKVTAAVNPERVTLGSTESRFRTCYGLQQRGVRPASEAPGGSAEHILPARSGRRLRPRLRPRGGA